MKKTLVLLNVITAVLLFALLIKEKYPQRGYRLLRIFFEDKPVARVFKDHSDYREVTDLYSVYSPGQKDIVMLGNSLTYRISWNELLGREDVANRGISGDITGGFLNRMNFVFNLQPKICFIEGGVNDLALHVDHETILGNLNTLVDTLRSHRIKPVLTTVTYVTSFYPNAIRCNSKSAALNESIKQMAEQKQVDLIDLNSKLAEGEFLRPENAIHDGIHFSSKAYKIWKEEIEKILEQEKI